MDFISSPIIRGWVEASNGAELKIRLISNRNVVEECVANKKRIDLLDKPNSFGFELKIETGFELKDFFNGTYSIIIHCDDGDKILPLWNPLDLASRIADSSEEVINKAINFLPLRQQMMIHNSIIKKINLSYAEKLDCELKYGDGTNYGDLSEDLTAVRGVGDNIFLYAGTNNVIELYRAKSTNPQLVERWHSLIDKRKRIVEGISAIYLQIFIPEKSSLTPYLAPFAIDGSTSLWRDIVLTINKNYYVHDLFDDHSLLNRENIFLRQDSHFSTYGAELAVRSLLERIVKKPIRLNAINITREKRLGDLAARFNAFKKNDFILETVELANGINFEDVRPIEVRLIHSFQPKENNMGSMRIWQCADAPINACVVCFGNSFFERGGGSRGLSWWFARIFKEFHFIWGAELDVNYIEKIKPDYVICQTIERFLGRCPSI